MMRFLTILALVTTLHGVAKASINPGDLITFTRIGGTYSGNGGEFSATVTDHTTHTLLQQFQTFCVEDNQTINLGTTYEVHSVLDRAITGPSYSPDTYGSLPADKIEGPTAWLFLQFWNTLYGGPVNAAFAATDYLNSVSGGNTRATNAGLLQNAIWYFESGPSHTAGSTNAYTTLANNNSAEWAAALAVVRAVNPIDDGHLDGNVTAGDTSASVHRQTQLVVIPAPPGNPPVPEPASLIVWGLLASVVGMTTCRRSER
jgi:hypothetical protein